MAFYGTRFIYDGIPSHYYDLSISSVSDSSSDYQGSNVELLTQELYRRPKSYLLGVKQTPVLTIPVTITVSTELSAQEASAVSRWLFGQAEYKKLQIIQPDMEYVYFNCIIKDPVAIRIGNIIRGYNANVVCDSAFAWEYPKRVSYSFDDYLVHRTITVVNGSDMSDYLYPTLELTTNLFGGYLQITNQSDNNRIFGINNLAPGEIVRVDNNIQTAEGLNTSVNHLRDMENYGYKWFRYVKGANVLNIVGNIDYLAFVHSFPKKVL